MSYRLVGPFDLDLDAQVASTRDALGKVAQAVREGNARRLAPVSAKTAGLYLLLEGPEEAQPKQLRIVGFWVVLGNTWMVKGPAGPPDREPPVAKALLDAATEEVWWESLPVASKKKGVWNPLVVLEWPPAIAWRAEVPPPGVADYGGDDHGRDQDEPESWLATPTERRARGEARADEPKDPQAEYYAKLPEERALVTVIRGAFRKSRALHTGYFDLLHPDLFGEGAEALPFDQWVDLALNGKPVRPAADTDPKPFGRPLALLNGSVGFPLASWLTRTLGVWPQVFADVRTGKLTDREVQVRWVKQARMALSSTVLVLAAVVAFTLGIETAAQPRPRPVEAAPPPAPQPAMSVCSADNQKFVDEFRCQIAQFAEGTANPLVTKICQDQGADASQFVVPRDSLLVDYCGLHDRSADKWYAKYGPATDANGPTYSWADVAGAQACFNVLGYPHPYESKLSSGKELADPKAFLQDKQLRIRPLVNLMKQLDSACDLYRGRLQSRIAGAIFATHIGARDTGSGDQRIQEAANLRQMAVKTALVGQSNDAKKCFQVGMDKGLSMTAYESMCLPEVKRGIDGLPVDPHDREVYSTKIWQQLDGPPKKGEPSLIDRYVRARFGPLNGALPSLPPLWECDLGLEGKIPRNRQMVLGEWEIPIPVPARFNTAGAGVFSQLQLDATLLKLRAGTEVDKCWDVVSKQLASYAPAHPLIAPLQADGWPSPEQQLCGQVCAAAYKITKPTNPTPWVTPQADLAACVTGEPLPRNVHADPGKGRLDRLRMPWNYAGRRGWIDPSEAHICAFNLIAQGRIPAGKSGYIVGGFSPQQWAGELPGTTRIAGYKDGLSVQAIVGMSRFGTGSAWSLSSCGHVALQCFTGVMMDVLGDRHLERYDWLGEWKKRIKTLSDEPLAQLAQAEPWCAPIQSYLSVEGNTASLDAPCREGIEKARANATQAIQTLAAETN